MVTPSLKQLAGMLGLSVLMCAGCGEPQSAPARDRPAHVPEEAVFAGGESGGEWMACRGASGGVLHCRIFDPRSTAFHESWFRYCPRLGEREAGDPMVLDWELGLRLSRVQLRRTRPDVYHPAPDATPDQVREAQELIDKYYELDGVDADCMPVAGEGSDADRDDAS